MLSKKRSDWTAEGSAESEIDVFNARRAWVARAAPVCIAVTFIVLGVLYARATPFFEAPDEASHFLYIHNLIEDRALPILEDRAAMFRSQSVQRHHPPLYYLISALLIAPIPRDLDEQLQPNPFAAIGTVTLNNQHAYLHPLTPDGGTALSVWIVRLFSLSLGAGTLGLIFKTGEAAFGRRVGLLAMALAASIPTFIFIHASINNDNLVTFLYSAGVYWLVRVWQRKTIRTRDSLLLMFILGGIALTKINGLTLFAVVAFGLVSGCGFKRYSWREAGRTALIAFVGAGILAGGWYVRNLTLYGDPLAMGATLTIWARGALPTDGALVLSEAKGVWDSFWLVLGQFNIRGAEWIYLYAAGITLVGMMGLARAFLWEARQQRGLIILCLAVIGAVIGGLVVATQQVNISQGRILFPGMVAFAPLIMLGWTALSKRAAPLMLVPLAAIAILTPFTILPAAYRTPIRVERLPDSARPIEAQAGGIELLGYEYQPDTLSPDGTITLDLYVRVVAQETAQASPVFFVKWVDPVSSVPVGGADFYPGMARTGDFDPDAIYRIGITAPIDRVRLTGIAPRRMNLIVGLRLPDPIDPLLETPPIAWTDANGTASTVLTLSGSTLLDPDYQPVPPQNATDVVYGEAIRLLGYSFSANTVVPGESVEIALYWQRIRTMDADYVTAVFLQNADGVIAQVDGTLPTYPTSAWRGDGIIVDTRVLSIPTDALPGAYSLAVGWYHADDQSRLPAQGAGVDVNTHLLVVPYALQASHNPAK